MNLTMKKNVLYFMSMLISAFLIFTSCGDDDNWGRYSYNDPTIYSPSETTLFSEVILFISPYIEQDGQKKFLVAEKLEDLSMKLNNKQWKLSDSFILDTLYFAGKETVGEYRVTDQKVKYPFVVNVRITYDQPETAGQYSDLLNSYISLNPGTYVCQLTSFDVKSIAGNSNTIYTPTLSFPLEVKENQASANLGEFEIKVN